MIRGLCCAVSGALIALSLQSSYAGVAADFTVANPAVHDNLSIYFIRGDDTGAPVPLTLGEATAEGVAKIHIESDNTITLENLSDRGVFVQVGTLLKGGPQDQVVARSQIVPPGGGRVPIQVYCVDPYRSTARMNEDPSSFSANGSLFPWRIARLVLLSADLDTIDIRYMRQVGVWASIDILRSHLADALGVKIPVTSLPLALESQHLAKAVRPFVKALAQPLQDDVIGAVFVINGAIEGAEIYQSHKLFGQMWPSLLIAYVTQAIASTDSTSRVPLSTAALAALLWTGEGLLWTEQTTQSHIPGPRMHADGYEPFIYTELTGSDGSWIYRGYVPKLPHGAMPATSDAEVAAYLDSGEEDGRITNNIVGEDRFHLMERDGSHAGADARVWYAFMIAAFSIGFGIMLALEWSAVVISRQRQLMEKSS